MKITYFLAVPLFLIFTACGGPAAEQNNSGDKTNLPKETVDLAVFDSLGTQITSASFLTLSGKVKSAIQEGGVPGAVGYCKISAHPLIESLSNVHSAKIKRTSVKPRNANNTPTPGESSVLKQFEVDWQLGKQVMPFSKDMGAQGVNFYAPIWTQKACLQCHGVLGETLTVENDNIIKGLYPTDKATGYKENDLRGMWVVQFENNQN